MEKVVLKNNEMYRDILDRIKLVIMQKVVIEKKAQDTNNRTNLGNCTFWFQKAADSDNHYLIFDKDTALWDLDRIKEDLDTLEYYIYKRSIY
jgi:hypothetical protein